MVTLIMVNGNIVKPLTVIKLITMIKLLVHPHITVNYCSKNVINSLLILSSQRNK